MQIVIDIPEEVYKQMISKDIYKSIHERLCYKAIQDGTPIPDNATNICGDNRFEIIAKAKEDIISATNIEDAKDEMKCLDSFLFRCWQMGWLDKYAPYQKGGKE